MITLGVDVGRWVGWAVLAEARYQRAGVLDVEELYESGVLDALAQVAVASRVELVAIERVERVLPTIAFQRGAASTATRLVLAAWLGGELAGRLRSLGIAVRTVSAEDVRRHFIAPSGRATKGEKPPADEVIEAVCAQQIAGWPDKIPGSGEAYQKSGANLLSDKRRHAADAAVAALYAGTVLR